MSETLRERAGRFRLSLGRSAAPIRKPVMAGVRGLRVHPISSSHYPAKNLLKLAREADLGPIDFHMRPQFRVDDITDELTMPPIQHRSADFYPPEFSGLDFEYHDVTNVAGTVVTLDGSGPAESNGTGRVIGVAPLFGVPLLREGTPTWQLSEKHVHVLVAAQSLVGNRRFILSDDLGTGKQRAATLALVSLFQQGEIGKALLIAPAYRARMWQDLIRGYPIPIHAQRALGDGLSVRKAWSNPGHVLIVTPDQALERLRGATDESELDHDVILLDGAGAVLNRTPELFALLGKLDTNWRWVLSGGPPRSLEAWRSLLTLVDPDGVQITPSATAAELRSQADRFILRRSKLELSDALPNRSRSEIWIPLGAKQSQAYEETLAEARHHLRKLGDSITRTHIEAVLADLDSALTMTPGTTDGAKVRALVQWLEEISAGGNKAIVFSHHRERVLNPIKAALDAFGALDLRASSNDGERRLILEAFRRKPDARVLLADLDSRTDGEPVPATYVMHLDVGWNAARRVRAEQRFFPGIRPPEPLSFFELWVEGSHEARLHALLEDQDLLPGDIASDTRPIDLEGRITIDDWLEVVLQIHGARTAAQPAQPERETTGLLPGTAMLRMEIASLSEDDLFSALSTLMKGFGFPLVELVHEDSGDALLVVATRSTSPSAGQVIARYVRSDSNVGVAEGRKCLGLLEEYPGSLGSYLVTNVDFTQACRALADKSEGRLALVSGPEFYRHLHLLGWA